METVQQGAARESIPTALKGWCSGWHMRVMLFVHRWCACNTAQQAAAAGYCIR
jgi:hypothetical protein